MPYKKEEFPIDDLVTETLDSIQSIAPTHKLILDGQTRSNVFADKDRIRQVLINFINNAIKYSPKADKVVISTSKDRDTVTIKVTDFGMGIPKAEQKKIFDRFYQAEAHGQTFSGLGLGLYISSEIIKRHNGRIGVESNEGKGSTFYFTIPRRG